MKIDDLLNAHAASTHITPRTKVLCNLIEKRMINRGSIRLNIWLRDVKKCVEEMQKELDHLKNFIEEIEKEDATET